MNSGNQKFVLVNVLIIKQSSMEFVKFVIRSTSKPANALLLNTESCIKKHYFCGIYTVKNKNIYQYLLLLQDILYNMFPMFHPPKCFMEKDIQLFKMFHQFQKTMLACLLVNKGAM